MIIYITLFYFTRDFRSSHGLIVENVLFVHKSSGASLVYGEVAYYIIQ